MPSTVARVDAAALRAAINAIEDPEMPIGLEDLGMIDAIELHADRADVVLLPTFAGCPALEAMRARVERSIAALGFAHVGVRWSFERAWTPDRVSAAGVRALRDHGIAPGVLDGAHAPACPYCASTRVERTSKFGGSLCRETYRCLGCGDRFESLKPAGVARPAADPFLISLV